MNLRSLLGFLTFGLVGSTKNSSHPMILESSDDSSDDSFDMMAHAAGDQSG